MQNIVEQLTRITFSQGIHKTVEDGVSALEGVSYIAGERYGEYPKCTCSVVRSMVDFMDRFFEGRYNAALAQRMLQIAGSRGDEGVSYYRALYLTEYLLRDFAPRLLRSPLFADHSKDYAKLAKELEQLPKLKANYELDMAESLLRNHKDIPRPKSIQEMHIGGLLNVVTQMRFPMCMDVAEAATGLLFYHQYITSGVEGQGTPFDALALLDGLLAIGADETPPLVVTPEVAGRIAYLANRRAGTLQ